MSTSSPVFKMFGRSPILPLQQHMAKCYECAENLLGFFEKVLAKDWEQAKLLQERISNLEHAADTLKKDLRMHLPKGLFMPVSRGDLLLLLHYQDEVANKAKDIAGLMLGRKMEIPDVLAEKFRALLKVSISATAQANKAISELDELFETGFGGNEAKYVNSMIEKLNEIEHETDQLQSEVYQSLFAIENQLSPVAAMFLYKLIEWFGDLANRSQQVGSRLQLLIAR